VFNVLIVDDEPRALSGIKRTFPWERFGFTVTTATTDSQHALDVLRNGEIHLALVDIRMPEISGLDLVQTARQENIPAEFVIISGYSEFDYARQALRHGVIDYCLKPIKFSRAEEILGKAADILRQKETRLTRTEEAAGGWMDSRIKKIVTFINDNLHRHVSMQELAERFNFHPNYGSVLFKKSMGQSYQEYVIGKKIDRACGLLEETDLSLIEIASRLGYEYYYFNKLFKRVKGTPPARYRQGRT
jgi:YesN/AraC family two-component response regulator